MEVVELIEFGELPAIRLRTPDGAQAIVTLFGAQVVSWIPADRKERLFCSARSKLDGTKAIRGGIPIIFPQFAERGDGVRHGFARLSTWRMIQSGVQHGACFAEFALGSEDHLPSRWPHDFALSLRVSVRARELHLTLRVRNIGQTPFTFSSALHTYFLLENLASVAIDGLEHTGFSDHTFSKMQEGMQTEHLLTLTDKLDRIYHRTADLVLACADNQLKLKQQGFVDTVVWNPGAADAAAISDLADDEFHQFICIEPALIEPFQLVPGAEWRGQHSIICT